MRNYFPPVFITVVFLGVYLMLYIMGLPLFMDFDVPWHIATGHKILELGALPATDSWSFTQPGIVWYNMSWTWDVLLAALESIGGLPLIYVFNKAFVAIVVALLIYHVRRRGVGSDALILTALLAAISFREFDAARSYLFGYLAVVIFHWLLHRSRAMQAPKELYWLPVLMVLWVNTHGSFLIGYTLIGAYGLEALITKNWRWFKQLLVIGIACVFAVLINPYGIGIYAAALRTLDSVTTAYITEWLPFVFGKSLGFSVWLLIFILAAGFRDRTIPLADKIISCIWLLAMFSSVRNGNYFVLVSAPFVAISLTTLLKDLESIRTRRVDAIAKLEATISPAPMLAVTLAVVIASGLWIDRLKGKSYVTLPEYDVQAGVAYVEKNLAGMNVLNDYNFGGRLIYYTQSRTKVFVDGRAGTAYPEATLSEYLRFMNLEKGWEEIISKYNIQAIFVANGQRFAQAYVAGQYHAQWKQVYRDSVSSVYLRK